MTAAPEVDVCIVGGGPAGLSVALGLATGTNRPSSGTDRLDATGTGGLRILLLEAGDAERAVLGGPAEVVGGDPYPQGDVTGTRAAFLGGTSGIWSYRMSNEDGDPGHGERGCRYAPLDEIDFEYRPEIPHSGWPLTRADLDPWYERAQPVCGLGPAGYTPQPWAGPGREVLGLDPELVETQMFQFGPRSAFTTGVVGRLRRAGVQIVTGADVTGLELDGEGRAGSVGWRNADGTTGTTRARAVVLAGGGIENSRLLLRTAGTAGPGLGNRYDQVGRYWMEHPIVRGGLIVAPAGTGLGGTGLGGTGLGGTGLDGTGLGGRLGLYDAHWQGRDKVMAKLSITPEAMRRERLGSTALLLLPRQEAIASAGFQAFTALRSPSGRSAPALARARLAAALLTHPKHILDARAAIAGQPGSDDSGWTARPGAERVRVLEMLHQTEQTPDPDNRVVLGDRRDALGREVPVLRWGWSEEDRSRITRARDLYAAAFASAGLGRLIQGDWDGGRPRMVGSTHHHMGGTRMSGDERTGVVDTDCRVHGSANVFIAGSSVFPTGGSVNPTLTIVALALRLGAHLGDMLGKL